MAVGKISKSAVDRMPTPAKGKREYLWDAELKGFGCMKTDKGTRSYLVQYRIGGRGEPTRRVSIGKHGSPWTPDTARDRAKELLQQIWSKVDPFEAERKAREEAKAEAERQAKAQAALEKLAFSSVADSYIDTAKKSLKRWKEQEGLIDRDLRPFFADTPLTDISPDDINDRLAEIAERSNSAARKSYFALRSIYSHAQKKHRKLLPTSALPFDEVEKPETGGKRDRHLDRREQRLMWEASKVLGWPFGPIYQLLLLTGLRLREVAHGHWSEIDLEEKSWLIPGDRTKNGETHWVHLSKPAIAILKGLPKLGDNSGTDLLFSTNGDTAVSGFSRAKKRLNKAMADIEAADARDEEREAQPIASFVIHDTRRTVARGCQKIGTPAEVVERVLGHKAETESGLKGVYQIYDFEKERKEALDKWASRLLANVNGSARVIKLRGAA